MNNETIEYRGYTIGIERDSDPANPWKEWDGEPPILVASWDRARWWMQAHGISADSLPELTREQIKKHAKEIASLTDSRDLLRVCTEWAPSYRSNYTDAAYMVNDALAEYYESQVSKGPDRLEFLASLYRIQGIAAYTYARNGYSQGDSLEILVAYTPEWLAEVGAVQREYTEQELAGSADLYAAWAFGDVYGYTVFDSDGNETDESCWGFYGNDHDQSGLLGQARGFVDACIREKQQQHIQQLKTWIRNRVPLQYRMSS